MKKILDERGQITVFLSLMFLVMAVTLLCVLDGARIYLNEGLAYDALRAAGKEVTANYSPALYKRYHLFFLDPREQAFIESDGMSFMRTYCGQNAGLSCESITVTEKKGVLDDQCALLKSQIKEVAVYQKLVDEKGKLSNLIEYQKQTDEKMEEEKTEIDQFDSAIKLEDSTPKDPDNSENDTVENIEETSLADTKQQKKDNASWKEIKSLLKNIFHSGILLYVTDDRSVSALKVDMADIPSGTSGEHQIDTSFHLSFDNIREIKQLLSYKDESRNLDDAIDDAALLSYIGKNFRNWSDSSWENDTALSYEMEYIIAGEESDHDNLKRVAEKIFLSRFVVNYAYAKTDTALNTRAAEIAAAVSGILGIPEIQEALRQILLAALSSGEALLDVHSLFNNRKVPMIKDSLTWTINFENAADILREKRLVKEGNRNLNYEDYLKLFLTLRAGQSINELRMADVMQWNIRLDQPDFLIERCLGAFTWEAEINCTYQYANPLGHGKQFMISSQAQY